MQTAPTHAGRGAGTSDSGRPSKEEKAAPGSPRPALPAEPEAGAPDEESREHGALSDKGGEASSGKGRTPTSGRDGSASARRPAIPRPRLTEEQRERYRTRFFKVWGYIGIILIVVFAFWALRHIGHAFLVLMMGAVLAFIFAPITNWLNKRFKIPRLPATLIGMAALVCLCVFLVGAVMPPLVRQSSEFLSSIPDYVQGVSQSWDALNAYLGSDSDGVVQGIILSALDSVSQQASQLGSTIASRAASGIVSGVSSLVTGIVDAFMAIVVSFWLAKDFPTMEAEVSNIVGPRRGEDYRIITTVFSRSLSGYLRGLIINSTCTGIMAWLGFWMLGIPYSGLLGIITAVLNVIPFIGPWIGGALGFLVGLSVGIGPALLSIVVTVIAQQLTDNFISPKVMQQAVSLHPVLVIFALTAGGSLGGVVGMICAVPLTAALKGVFVYYFELRTRRQLVSKRGMLFRGEPFNDEQGNPLPGCDALGVDITGDQGVPERIRAAMADPFSGMSAPAVHADARGLQETDDRAEERERGHGRRGRGRK